MYYDKKIKKRWMDIREADILMTQQLENIKVSVSTARKCFFMAKMSVQDEKNNVQQYTRLELVEFLEMLCRIAMYQFEENNEWTWAQKLEFVVENVLAIRDIQRKPVNFEIEVDSEADISDEDY